MGTENHSIPRTGPARARLLGACLAALLAAGCRREAGLPAERRIPLAAPVAEGATLAVDSAGLLWIGTPGRLAAMDTAGRVVSQVRMGRDSVPRVLWRTGPRLVILDGRRLSAADAAGGTAAFGWGSTAFRAAARDPRGRWVYAAGRRGGILGLDPATLRPRWGWAETGGDALGVAVSPLADRVYVSVDGAGEAPPAVQVRDAVSGRVLLAEDQADPLRGLTAGPDGTLYGHADGLVVRMRHGPEGLRRVWSESPGVGGPAGGMELRVDPSGARVAVFGRGRGARLAVLDALTGRVLGQTTAPLDAAFGMEGRLYLLEAGGVRVMR
jgi:DNA-binding beta-propeller fold protein YncE